MEIHYTKEGPEFSCEIRFNWKLWRAAGLNRIIFLLWINTLTYFDDSSCKQIRVILSEHRVSSGTQTFDLCKSIEAFPRLWLITINRDRLLIDWEFFLVCSLVRAVGQYNEVCVRFLPKGSIISLYPLWIHTVHTTFIDTFTTYICVWFVQFTWTTQIAIHRSVSGIRRFARLWKNLIILFRYSNKIYFCRLFTVW